MITVSLNEIRAHSPCELGWKKVLASKGGTSADVDAQFPITDILESNDLDDTLWTLRCRPEYSNLWRKFAVWAARQVEGKLTDQRSRDALDVAWRHSEGLATDDELAAARDAAGAAARAAAGDAAVAAALQNLMLSVCADLPIAQEHRDYARDAWGIWRAGYGCAGKIGDEFIVYERP